MTLISPGDCTLQCGMWLSNRDSEFTKWQHPAMWYVALGWHMPLNSPKRLPYWNSTSGFDFDHIDAVDMSFCTSPRNFYLNRTTLGWKNDVMSIFKMADLSHLGFWGFCNRHHSSKLLSFWENRVILHFGDRQTDTQTNIWTAPMHVSRSSRERRLNKLYWKYRKAVKVNNSPRTAYGQQSCDHGQFERIWQFWQIFSTVLISVCESTSVCNDWTLFLE